jgi:preprotein translocase subunit SecG
MQVVILVIHLLLAVALIGVILLQRSEGGALGMGGGGGGMSGFLTGRATANLLTRATAVLAALFFLTSMGLTWLGGKHEGAVVTAPAPVSKPAPAKPAAPSAPSAPSAPTK